MHRLSACGHAERPAGGMVQSGLTTVRCTDPWQWADVRKVAIVKVPVSGVSKPLTVPLSWSAPPKVIRYREEGQHTGFPRRQGK